MDIPRHWRNRNWRYSLTPRHPGALKEGVKHNPILTLAQLALLDQKTQDEVHKTMKEGGFRNGRASYER